MDLMVTVDLNYAIRQSSLYLGSHYLEASNVFLSRYS